MAGPLLSTSCGAEVHGSQLRDRASAMSGKRKLRAMEVEAQPDSLALTLSPEDAQYYREVQLLCFGCQ